MVTTKKVSFALDGEEFVLNMNFAALCKIEEDTDTAFTALAATLQTGDARLSTIVALFRGALLKERPEITHAEAIDLIEKIGPERAVKLTAEAIEQSSTFGKKGKAKTT